MDPTAQEIRTREQQSTTNETPTVADPGGGDDGAGGSSLPVPSISKKHLAIVGAIVAAIVIWKLYQMKTASGSASLREEREKLSKSHEVEAAPEEEDDRISVPIDPTDPLAADKAVVEALRANGKLKNPDSQ